MAKSTKEKDPKRTVQTVLNFPSTGKALSTTCGECGMTYYYHIAKDTELHKKYHFSFVNGLVWPESMCGKVIGSFDIMVPVRKGKGLKSKVSKDAVEVRIVSVEKGNKRQILKTEQLLQMVNQELNAPQDPQSWKDELQEAGRAFLLVIDNRAIGICSTDPITNLEVQSRWMIHKTQQLVPKQVNRATRVGISRIWVAPKWRRFGLAKNLLQIVLDHTFYGIKLKKAQVSFSQPSYSGGELAKSFNGVIHKSGEVLVPVYLE
ncbi:N-acetyltransferase ECO1 [Suhomyces tanzawaensis NRRL Y-17324]|uniref:N-acetyltransferase ECO1 n=1 Tax=Suhomyces tanzawaensis NRRL Y-17324 TaxID=984487 RepID=A0A1E4SDE0_9ASCO|nr:N-acetyltransferase ECO1 [Suhomyces tanzawaensis NRRL Y-17324]ODV77537.1 N-acetyltransferase ECO1 [Suhomyces tanzawaensis NRRL Y-17324]